MKRISKSKLIFQRRVAKWINELCDQSMLRNALDKEIHELTPSQFVALFLMEAHNLTGQQSLKWLQRFLYNEYFRALTAAMKQDKDIPLELLNSLRNFMPDRYQESFKEYRKRKNIKSKNREFYYAA